MCRKGTVYTQCKAGLEGKPVVMSLLSCSKSKAASTKATINDYSGIRVFLNL